MKPLATGEVPGGSHVNLGKYKPIKPPVSCVFSIKAMGFSQELDKLLSLQLLLWPSLVEDSNWWWLSTLFLLFLFPISFYLYLTSTVNKKICTFDFVIWSHYDLNLGRCVSQMISISRPWHWPIWLIIILADNELCNLAKIEHCLEISSIFLYLYPLERLFIWGLLKA